MNLGTATGWLIRELNNGYLAVARYGKPGEILVNAADEGFVVDVWGSDPDEPEATAFAPYADLSPTEDTAAPETANPNVLAALIECADYLAEFLEEGREHRVIKAADAAIQKAVNVKNSYLL